MKKEKSCGAVVFYMENGIAEILLIKHANSGHWSFPKGHVEYKETEEETALREIMEETGVLVDIDTNFRSIVTYSPKKDVVKDVIYFVASAKNKNTKRQEREVSDIMWANLDEAVDFVSYKNDKILVQKAIEYFKNIYINQTNN